MPVIDTVSVHAERTRPARETDAALAVAARAGDLRAQDALFRAHLPMIYNLARQALGDSPDVDDVVQEVALRALRQLPRLREPASFRPWLAAIAVHQIGTHLARSGTSAGHTAPLEAAAWKPDADIEGPALLRAMLAGQRRQVRSATRWLSADDRSLLSLWWLETAGELTRAEVARTVRASVPHTGVLLHRMREQLDLSRSIVAALEAMPGCDALAAAIADWNGVPSPFWRKRIGRHTRSCPVCARAAEGQIPLERLLAGIALLPLPAALAETTAQTIAAGIGPASAGGVLGRALAGLRSRPRVVAAATGVAVVVTVVVAVNGRSAPPVTSANAPILVAPAATAPSPPALPAGEVSLESANLGGRFVSTTADGLGVLAPLNGDSSAAARRRATFEVVPGLAGTDCYSFRTTDGRWLRHASFRLRPSREEATVLFRRDATFCLRNGAAAGTLSLESYNYSGYFIRHVGTEMWVDQDDSTAKFRSDRSFRVRPPLA